MIDRKPIMGVVLCLMALLVPGVALAQTGDSTIADAEPVQAHAVINPKLTAVVRGIDDGSEGPPLDITRMNVAIDQHGTNAIFDFEITIRNPCEDAVEGRFEMRLPRDAVLTGYALDIDGRMVPGSLIDQPKARQVFDDEVRRGIDPGLAEISGANVFSTRIFPIDASDERTISLRFATPVDSEKGLTMPLATERAIGELTLKAQFSGLASEPAVSLGPDRVVKLERASGGWSAMSEPIRNQAITGALIIGPSKPRQAIALTRHNSGNLFFALEGEAEAVSLADSAPERLRVYWDRSRSRADALIEEERAVLKRVIDGFAPAKIQLVPFDSSAPAISTHSDSASVDAALAAIEYRGATSFEGLDALELEDAELCLVFTDGGRTLGEQTRFAPDCPTVLIASGPRVDSTALGRLARDSAGSLLFLDETNGETILAQIQTRPVSVVSIRDVAGRRLSFRSLPAEAGRWKVVGEASQSAKLTVKLAGTRRADRTQVFEIESTLIDRHDAAGALWATQEVARLSDNPARRNAMRDMAERYQVASPTMAFLVLETPRQYLDAGITPPKAFNSEWLADYSEQKTEREEQEAERKQDHLDFVFAQWDEAKDWWATEFDQKAAFERSRRDRGSDAAVDGDTGGMNRSPPASSVSASEAVADAAEAAEAAVDSDGEQYIVVTGSRVQNQDLSSVSPVQVIAEEGFQSVDAQGNTITFELEDVLSDKPYIALLRAAEEDKRLTVLRQQEDLFGELPVFYLETSEWFRIQGDQRTARELLLSALDLVAIDDETRLTVAFRLQRAGEHELALALFEELAARTGNRPQPRRTLALALIDYAASLPESERRAHLERAFGLLVETALDPTTDAYAGIETVALMEANALIPRIDQLGGKWQLDERLVALLDTDVRIVIEWTGADEDLDLWVTEPTGEQASYSNQRTALGGKVSDDMTAGYGPEEYVLRRGATGKYEVRVKGYSGDRINPNGAGRVLVRLTRHFGRANEATQLIDAEIGFDRDDADSQDRAIATLEIE